MSTTFQLQERRNRHGRVSSDEDLYRMVFDTLPFGIVVTGKDEEIVSANPAFLRLCDLTPAALCHRRFSHIFALTAEREDGRSIRGYERDAVEVTFSIEQGKRKGVRFSGLKKALPDESGYVYIFKSTRDEFSSSDGMQTQTFFTRVGKSASSIAHEIRNPLGGITGYASVLGRHFDPSDPRTKIVQRIMENAENVNRIIENLLEFTCVTEPSLEKTDLRDILDSVLDVTLINGSTVAGSVKVEKAYSACPAFVLCDRIQMKEAFYQLVMNAIDAMHEGGILTVALERAVAFDMVHHGRNDTPMEFIRTSVSDTGSGMDPEQLNRAFDLFYSTKGEGSGLGLSIVEKIISHHHGTIDIESAKQRGTTVTVSLMEYNR
jgi:signal transduction histidine kinase